MATTTLIKRSLEQHEEIIEAGVKSFIDVGRSLLAIRDGELYKKDHDTFESYCSKRWGFSRPRAYQLIESSVVVSDLSTNGRHGNSKNMGVLPENERQARALAESAPDAKTREAIWTASVESAPKKEDGTPNVTAAVVKKAAESLGVKKPPKTPAKPKSDAEKPLPIPERQPGDESEISKPKTTATVAKNGKATVIPPAYDKQAIEKSYGSLVRLIDDMARVSNLNNSPHHRECTSYMSKSLDTFRLLAKECDAVHARKGK